MNDCLAWRRKSAEQGVTQDEPGQRGPGREGTDAVARTAQGFTVFIFHIEHFDPIVLGKNSIYKRDTREFLFVCLFFTRLIAGTAAVKSQSRVDCHQESVPTAETPGRGQRAER